MHIPLKPKGMHENTYHCILNALDCHECVRHLGVGYPPLLEAHQHQAHVSRQCRNRFAAVGGWPVR
jgi:hypothetical protein